MRARVLLLALAAALAGSALPPGAARAEVVGSPHDLFNSGYLVVPEEKLRTNPQCLSCHFAAPEDRPLLGRRVPPSLWEYGSTGVICASCHDGVAMVDRNVDAGLTVFHPESHRFTLKEPPPDTLPARSGLGEMGSGRFSCTTCHEPHAQSYRPFMRYPVTAVCQKCHLRRTQEGFGHENKTGDHPIEIDPFDSKGGASPISVQPAFALSFPAEYPKKRAAFTYGTHWKSGGHLSLGAKGKVGCVTCHAFHGREGKGPALGLLAVDPVRKDADEFCEGCHRGKRGDGEKETAFPNPGGTLTGRTYHPVDDDRANGLGWNAAIASTSQLRAYVWGTYDPDYKVPRILCTTCHVAHRGMADSPCLAPISTSVRDDGGVVTFCEACHRDPPEGHHGYAGGDGIAAAGSWQAPVRATGLGRTYGTQQPGKMYCSICHRAHNAGYGQKEADYIPILVDRGVGLCEACHAMGVSHFLGDPTLPSTYNKARPAIKRTPWTPTGKTSFYEGEGEAPNGVTCTSCHTLSKPVIPGSDIPDHLLLAPAGEDDEWEAGKPDTYLCTGCHSDSPATVGAGVTHPLLSADRRVFPLIPGISLLAGETPATYTRNGGINCHTCHVAHRAALPGGVYVLKIVRGGNTDPKAIQPLTNYRPLCHSCHPAERY